MFIQTEDTPNPATLKFLPGREVMGTRPPADFPNAAAAAASPLAEALFAIDDVASVFLGADFIAVSKGESEWQHMKPAILQAIMEHFVADKPVMIEGQEGALSESQGHSHNPSQDEDDETVAAIKQILDTRVRPAVAQDGGDIVFHGFEDGVVSLHLRGACAGCPSATATLKQGVENLLKHYVPSIIEVRAVL